MFESFGFETVTAPALAPWLGLVIGLLFGLLAEATGFCFRRAVTGPAETRRPALGIWMAALAAAVLGTQAAVAAGLISFAEHRFHAADLPLLALLVGGGLFGAGMVLTRGCISRLAVLTGSGNLRAGLVLIVFAVVAQATLKGALAPLRTALAEPGLPLGLASLGDLPGGPPVWALALSGGAFALALRSGAPRRTLGLALLLGLLVPAAWLGTGVALYDDFDPIPFEALAFTAPAADTLFWAMAATALKPGFGVGLVAGVLAGGALGALAGGRFHWQSFESPGQTGRYLAGAALMGVGGVLAGGCTVGAGLSGVPTLGVSAIVALGAIAAGARVTERLLTSAPLRAGLAGSAATRRPRQRA